MLRITLPLMSHILITSASKSLFKVIDVDAGEGNAVAVALAKSGESIERDISPFAKAYCPFLSDESLKTPLPFVKDPACHV